MSEPLVLIPGFGCDARVFTRQVEVLSRRVPVTILPAASGERIEEIASAALPHLPSRFALAGQGFGGMVAMEIVRRAADRVQRLALLATTPLPDTPAEAAAREPRVVALRGGRMEDAISGEIPASALAPGATRTVCHAQLMTMARDLGKDALLRQIRALRRRKDQQAALRKARVPVLVLAGAHDTLVPEKRQRFLAELVPHGQLEMIEDAGHLPSIETPDAVTDALSDWLEAPLILR